MDRQTLISLTRLYVALPYMAGIKRGGLTSAEWKRRERERIGERETDAVHLSKRMGYYLKESRRRMRLEQEVTAFFGIQTSWALILDAAKYTLTPES